MSSVLALHIIAAGRGDVLRPVLVEALKQQSLIDHTLSISRSGNTSSSSSDPPPHPPNCRIKLPIA